MMKNLIVKTFIFWTVLVGHSLFAKSQEVVKKIHIKKSTINWVGYKLSGSHKGKLSFDSGFLNFRDGKLVSGEFLVNMNSLQVSDLAPGRGKEDLEFHLKSPDFFDSANYQYSKVVINNCQMQNDKMICDGQVIIKEKSEKMDFLIEKHKNFFEAKLKLDRTKFGIIYGSVGFFDKLKDRAIKNIFEVQVKIFLE